MIDKDDTISLLLEKNIPVKGSERYKNIAWRIKLESGTAVFVYDSGGFFCQGKEADKVREAIEHNLIDRPNNKVFVVYGHDESARRQLSRLLHDLKLEPLFLNDLPDGGKTIIEKLEEYIPQANYGIVLMTPDDRGSLADSPEPPKPRARQNVVLELGMLFMKFGRSRISVVLKTCDPAIERPSDNDVYEIKSRLVSNLKSKGYKFEEDNK